MGPNETQAANMQNVNYGVPSGSNGYRPDVAPAMTQEQQQYYRHQQQQQQQQQQQYNQQQHNANNIQHHQQQVHDNGMDNQSGKYNHWSTSYKLHYNQGGGGGVPNTMGSTGVTVAASNAMNQNQYVNNGAYPGQPVYNSNNTGMNNAYIPGSDPAAASYGRTRPMSAGATVSSSRQQQQQQQYPGQPVPSTIPIQQPMNVTQQPVIQVMPVTQIAHTIKVYPNTNTVPNTIQLNAQPQTQVVVNPAVVIPSTGAARPVSANATNVKTNNPHQGGRNAVVVNEEDSGDDMGALGEHSGLNGNTGRKISLPQDQVGDVGVEEAFGDEDDEELDDELEIPARRHVTSGSGRGGIGSVEPSQSRTHPEVSTIADLAGGTVSMDIRSIDSYMDGQPVNIGLTTVPNQFCSVHEAVELRKLLMLSNNNVRGGMIPSSTAVMDMYMVGKVIGVGSYGKVRAAWHRLTGSKVAIKTYDKAKLKDPAHWKRVHSEIKITEQTSHPRIARLFEAIETPKRMHLIMECLDGGNLCSYVKQKRRLSEEESKRIFFQLLQAMDYLHVMGVAHRDIKLENVLFGDNKDIKLIDFGFSTVCVPGKKLRVFCGTPSYMAPGMGNNYHDLYCIYYMFCVYRDC